MTARSSRWFPLSVPVSAVLALSLGISTPSWAQWFVNPYAGSASTRDARIDASQTNVSIFGTVSTADGRDVSFESSAIFGLRGGYWFETYPWLGAAVDLSYFEADAEDVRIHLVPISVLLMFRLPLFTNAGFPKGRLQPYAAIGPAFGPAFTSIDFRPAVFDKVSGLGEMLGVDLRTGLAWQFHREIAIMSEYRFTSVDLNVETDEDLLAALTGGLATNTISRATATLKTERLLLGLSFRFSFPKVLSHAGSSPAPGISTAM